ncbi:MULTISPECIES: hypothetical protein [Spirulina sp. CCY15215]|uniref:hypothetical protein n=1 Tax=Spirulina sp. CCY15215 TaxID=2767591 RepID=UPI0019525620|nr:hypothetical protein [Spirulina major]
MNHFAVLMEFLRDRLQFLENIRDGKYIEKYILAFAVCSSLFLGLYGGILGSFSGWLQAISSAIKLPALYLLTLLICLPSLFFFDVVCGSKRTFWQYCCLLLASMSVVSIMLFGFAPISLFFRLSMDDYNFFKLLNVVILIVSSFVGVQFFYRGILFINDIEGVQPKRRDISVKAWLVLYGFVGSQLGWTLRPIFGSPGKSFEIFRNLESNFYAHLVHIISQFFGIN